MPPKTPTPAARVPRTPFQWGDLIVGIILMLITLLLAVVMLAQMGQLFGLATLCDGIAPDGARCNPVFLDVLVIIGFAIVIFAAFLGAAWLIVRATRRKSVFWIPLLSGAVILASFYVPAIVLGSSYLPAS